MPNGILKMLGLSSIGRRWREFSDVPKQPNADIL
jgi:hypothetical protein